MVDRPSRADAYELRSPGELLSVWRMRANHRLSDISKRSGVPYATLWGIFHDRRKPRAHDLRAIVHALAEGLGEDPEELWRALGPLLDPPS
jgi:transcriptional regulator with XRE-family HTH domain